MPGDGTRTGITTSNPPAAWLLDVTRLASRAGRVLTGIDRVEYAYARALSQQDVPCFGLLRSSFGMILVRPDRLWPAIQDIFHGDRPTPDLLSRLARRKSRAAQEAETAFRRAAVARGRRRNLAGMLAGHLPRGFSYINVGHSNLDARVFRAVRDAGGRSAVMVHDVIPLEHPEYQRDGTVARFAEKMQVVRAEADLLLYNSQDTRRRAEAALGVWGAVPPGLVSLLGVETDARTAKPDENPYFVALGTIEPRKNIGFLLDLWEEMGGDAPGLVICGARGWNNAEVFARLDALPEGGKVREVSGASDAARDALLAGARGLLFPSHAEGFGLPALEAAAQGVPVICNTLEIFRETLGDNAIYASVEAPYLWIKEIRKLARAAPGGPVRQAMDVPTWDAHFKAILSMV